MKTLTGRQHEILNAALDIMADRGIQRMTIKNLAEAVGVSEPALYRHFRSKFDILMSILSWYRQFIRDIIVNRHLPDTTVMERIGYFYDAMFASFIERPAVSMVIFSEDLFHYDKRLSKEVNGIIEMTHDHIHTLLRNGVRNGSVRRDIPSKQLAWIVMGTMRLLITKWRIAGYSFDLAGEGRRMTAHLAVILKP